MRRSDFPSREAAMRYAAQEIERLAEEIHDLHSCPKCGSQLINWKVPVETSNGVATRTRHCTCGYCDDQEWGVPNGWRTTVVYDQGR